VIERTTLDNASLGGGDTPAEVIERRRKLAALGIQQVIFGLPNVHQPAPLEIFGREIIPAVAEFE
jgi:hypothetical protein